MSISNQVELVICMRHQILVSFIINQRAFLNQKAFAFCRKAPNDNPGSQFLNYFYIYPQWFNSAKTQQQIKLKMENSWRKKNNLSST